MTFKDSIHETAYFLALEDQAPVDFWHTAEATAIVASAYVRHRVIGPLVCKALGHRLVDLDEGNPEVGPRPEIVCTRCHDEW